MKFTVKPRPSASEATMFGCECALPFLTGLHGDALRTKGVLSVAALGALLALAACDGATPDASRHDNTDKLSEALDKATRQVERAKARLKRDPSPAQGQASGVAEADASQRP